MTAQDTVQLNAHHVSGLREVRDKSVDGNRAVGLKLESKEGEVILKIV